MSINNLVLIGNLVETPAVQVVPSTGVSRARFRIASTERRRDPATNTWRDGESVFVAVTCWRKLAEHVAISLQKGDRVIVSGRLRQWVAETEGVRRTVHEIEADAVGPDLLRGVVTVARNRRPDAADAAEVGEVGEVGDVNDEDDLSASDVLSSEPDSSGGGSSPEPEPDSLTAPAESDAWLPPLATAGL